MQRTELAQQEHCNTRKLYIMLKCSELLTVSKYTIDNELVDLKIFLSDVISCYYFTMIYCELFQW